MNHYTQKSPILLEALKVPEDVLKIHFQDICSKQLMSHDLRLTRVVMLLQGKKTMELLGTITPLRTLITRNLQRILNLIKVLLWVGTVVERSNAHLVCVRSQVQALALKEKNISHRRRGNITVCCQIPISPLRKTTCV